MLTAALLSIPIAGPLAGPLAGTRDLVALRVGRAETIANGTIEHAVILIEDGEIVRIGQDLTIGRGIRVVDHPDWVVTPGLVNCHSQMGMDSDGGKGFEPHLHASGALYARQDVWAELLEAGVTTLGLVPDGDGIPGQAVAVRPHGEDAAAMTIRDSVYLKINLVSDPASKKTLREAFEEVDEYEEELTEAREKWEKEEEKRKKKAERKKKDDESAKKKDDDEDLEPQPFVPPDPDEKVVPFRALRAKELTALMSIRKASDYLHLLDVIEDEDIEWSLHVPLRTDVDLYEVADRIGEAERRVAVTSTLTLQPHTRRERNIAAELDRAGARVVLLPERDSLAAHESWMHDVGRLVAAGLDRDAALAAVTLEPAHVLGLADRIGSLEEGKEATLVLWDGDPFEPSTRVQAVMLEGRFVTGDVR